MEDTSDNTEHGSRVRLDEAAWAALRRLYEAGESTRMLAERFGLGERTVRRRAALEGWTRRPLGAWETACSEEAVSHLEHHARQRQLEADDLLFTPTAKGLRDFAFRRAAEAAALGRPAEGTAWLRMLDQLRRNHVELWSMEQRPHEGDLRRAVVSGWLGDTLFAAPAEDAAAAGDDA